MAGPGRINEPSADGSPPSAPLALVIEDDQALQRLIRLELSLQGIEVVGANTGDEGLALAAKLKPDVACLDLGLPGMDGQETLSALKGLGIPVLVATGRTEEDVLLDCLERGADCIIVKPFPPEDLEAKILFLIGLPEEMPAAGPPVRIGDLEIDLRRRAVTRQAEGLALSHTEWRLLEILVTGNGSPVLHKELLSQVWGPHFQRHIRFLQAWMERLQKKLDHSGSVISDFAGVGYASKTATGPPEP